MSCPDSHWLSSKTQHVFLLLLAFLTPLPQIRCNDDHDAPYHSIASNSSVWTNDSWPLFVPIDRLMMTLALLHLAALALYHQSRIRASAHRMYSSLQTELAWWSTQIMICFDQWIHEDAHHLVHTAPARLLEEQGDYLNAASAYLALGITLQAQLLPTRACRAFESAIKAYNMADSPALSAEAYERFAICSESYWGSSDNERDAWTRAAEMYALQQKHANSANAYLAASRLYASHDRAIAIELTSAASIQFVMAGDMVSAAKMGSRKAYIYQFTIGDRVKAAQAYNEAARAWAKIGKYMTAAMMLDAAIKIDPLGHYHVGAAKRLVRLGRYYEQAAGLDKADENTGGEEDGLFLSAVKSYKTAAHIYKKNNDCLDCSLTLDLVARLYRLLPTDHDQPGMLISFFPSLWITSSQKAQSYANAATASLYEYEIICDKTAKQLAASGDFLNAGHVYLQLNEFNLKYLKYPAAGRGFESAASYYQTGHHLLQAECALYSAESAYTALGNCQEAIDRVKRTVALVRKKQHADYEASLLENAAS